MEGREIRINMPKPNKIIDKIRSRRSRHMQTHYKGDGVGVRGKNMDFLHDPKFVAAWDSMLEGNHGEFRNKKWFKGRVPDVRWRAHLNCWAAHSALKLDGDFVECGTATGFQAATVCNYLDFQNVDKSFFLFDTFAGIPVSDELTEKERTYAQKSNKNAYFDCYSAAEENFSPWSNVQLLRGILPGTLLDASINKIAYLHIDLNNASAEMETIQELWGCITAGAPIILDDYAFRGHEDQYAAWNKFSIKYEHPIFTLPTGQGLMIKR